MGCRCRGGGGFPVQRLGVRGEECLEVGDGRGRGKTDKVQASQRPAIARRHRTPLEPVGETGAGFDEESGVARKGLQDGIGAFELGPFAPLTGGCRGWIRRRGQGEAGGKVVCPQPDLVDRVERVDQAVDVRVRGVDVEIHRVPPGLERIRLRDPLGAALKAPARHEREDKPGKDAGGDPLAGRSPGNVVTHKCSPCLRGEIGESFRGTSKNFAVR
jgi:hypothetical protein